MRLFFLVLCLAISASANAQTYITTFPLTENPISEGGRWVNGAIIGLDWKNVATRPGLAMGTQVNSRSYDDSTALLTGSWGPDQTVYATVYCTNPADGLSEEVEIRLRSTISAHSNTGYEINFNCATTGGGYSQVVRWNGALGDFTVLNRGPGVRSGDVVMANMVGNTITVQINGLQVMQVRDDAFTAGNPGMGFFQRGAAANNAAFGFSSYTATAQLDPPIASTSLHISIGPTQSQ
jgi:hypothetical protein